MSRPSIFDAEFRARACELARSSSKPRVQIAADLGVSDATLYKWMAKTKTPKNDPPDGEDRPLTLSELEVYLTLCNRMAGCSDRTQGSLAVVGWWS